MTPTRETELVRTLVQLADTLVEGFDVVDLLALLVERSVDILDVSAAGLVLTDHDGAIRLMASTSDATEMVELFEIQTDEGPCRDCCRVGTPIVVGELAGAEARWPHFVPIALGAGFGSAHAVPLRLRGQVLGALNLFDTEQGALSSEDLAAGQALADVATIALLQQRAMQEAHTVATQLQHALDSRVVIEQAKGVIAERLGVPMDEAFVRLRQYARAHQLGLTQVAREVVAGTLDASRLVAPRPA